MTDPDAGAKLLSEFIGLAWDGLTQDARVKGYPMWSPTGVYQGGAVGLREVAASISAASNAELKENAHHLANMLRQIVPALKQLAALQGLHGVALGAQRADELLRIIARALPHDWVRPAFIGHDFCRVCGVVRALDGADGPCLGLVGVGVVTEVG